MSLAIRLRHDFPSARIDIDFQVPSPGVTVLFGPSGAGKSVTIAVIALAASEVLSRRAQRLVGR